MAEVMGYSMGGFITLNLLMEHPQRFGRAVIGGVGENYFAPVTVNVDLVVEALLAPSAEAVSDPVAKGFRVFAQSQNNDLEALAACFRRPRHPFTAESLSGITHETLIVAGEKDAMIGSPEILANAIPHAKLVTIKDRDHMLTVGDKAFKDAVTDFLGAR
jgi:pimeloyl-ACP methyl ester carboxylesterase